MANNKNQHFVPRCYLRAFTQDGESLAINLLNLRLERAIASAPVKNQCSGDYFYGQDDRLEAAIRAVEGSYASVVAKILTPRYELNGDDKSALRIFMLFQHMRTEAASRRLVEMFAGMEQKFGVPLPDVRPSVKEAVQMAMRAFGEQMDLFSDLKICLIRNRTKKPFLTSDDPAVVANRWHKEDLRTRNLSPGLMSCGTTVFLPLNPRILCIAYDGDVYSIPHERGWTEMRDEADVAACNEQQFLNAWANVYFQDWNDHQWVRGSYQAVQSRRLGSRHRVTYAVLDKSDERHKRYRVVERPEAHAHDEALLHTQSLSPTPSRWPNLLRWRAKGHVFTNGSGAGYIRAAKTAFRRSADFWREPSRR
ncbi:DUF4238 domain-containing protein [Hydrogenophaga sp. IBVHS1]|uniref:DUF4238 domain-containing protein n=1 Tax=unclassified Hydrogenophaga TaxID=2610897 RepID=UPI000A2DD03A|nr:DUF4238 domain-containing protein [Hydrogenophaga sp. IBVHS1]OSZ76053.1 hypothetical protein CAP37_12060 [Hydrogenophaga sp. IBVHS1]